MTIGQPERATQNRVLALFNKELGYRLHGDWTDRPNNSNIEADLLSADYARRFPGIRAADHGLEFVPHIAADTMRGWRP